ncbi:MAG: APC family permease, partial [Actinomycetes bacterium]
MFSVLKRLVVGRPLATTEQEHQRISKKIALAVFSSDAISSTAYATEEILFVVALGASSLALGLDVLIPIAIAVAVLLAIVVTSYRQTIFAYPSGGGSYVVSRENLGETPSLVAGASLLVDYILTVAVSISAGVAAIVSIPALRGLATHRVELGLVLILIISLANLRGLKESGSVFSVPTYTYIVMLTILVGWGLYSSFTGNIGTVPFDKEAFDGTREFGGTLGLFLILKGFSSGAVALTGVEAISNGVPAFKRPESKNAATTLVWMAFILGGLFFGVSLLAHRLQPYPSHEQTVFSQMGLLVFGEGSVLYIILQFATAAILVLAANTAYADFPRISSIIAADGFLPKQLTNRGDRLVFSNGVLVLALSAGALIVVFGGVTNALIPLYAVGVFTSFTLSQSGMVVHHLKEREPGWRRNTALNGVGALTTFIVLMIVAITKFSSGAWVPVIVIPIILLVFKVIHRHYERVRTNLAVTPEYRARPMNHTVVVLVGTVHRGVLDALAYARSLNPHRLLAVSVVSD